MMHTKLYALRHGDRSFGFLGFDDFLGRRLTSGAFYEQGMLDYISRLGITGTYLDVGAFVGTHTVFFSELCPTCTRVLSFEPVPDSYAVLSENIRNNCARVPVLPRMVAIGERCRTCALAPGLPDNSGMSHVDGIAEGSTEMTTIDGEVSRAAVTDVGLIKIDVEAYELEVVTGAKNTIVRMRPHLFIECVDPERLKTLTATLDAWNYRRIRAFNVSPTHHFEPQPI